MEAAHLCSRALESISNRAFHHNRFSNHGVFIYLIAATPTLPRTSKNNILWERFTISILCTLASSNPELDRLQPTHTHTHTNTHFTLSLRCIIHLTLSTRCEISYGSGRVTWSTVCLQGIHDSLNCCVRIVGVFSPLLPPQNAAEIL